MILNIAFDDLIVAVFPKSDFGFSLNSQAGGSADDFFDCIEINGKFANWNMVWYFSIKYVLTLSLEFIFSSNFVILFWFTCVNQV